MGLYTRITRAWLERRFEKRSAAGVYLAHMPIYGIGESECEGNHLGRLARLLRILRVLDALDFRSLLDVGGAEGWLCHLVRTLQGGEVVSTDLSREACLRAGELFGVPAAAVDSHRLPFADGAFDVVVCSEVIEHVEHPVETMLELQRVAATAVILTTEELHYDRAWIDGYLFRRPGWPHMERNLFHPDDLAACFPGAALVPQCDEPPPSVAPDRAGARAWLLAHTRATTLEHGRLGVVVADVRRPSARRPRRHDDAALVDHLLGTIVAKGALWPTPPPLADLVARLRDPSTRAPLVADGDWIAAPGGRRHPFVRGVPDLVDLDGAPPARAELERELATRAPDRAAALLALRDRLFLPERWTQDRFDLRDAEQRRGFWPNDQLEPRPGGAGFSWRSTGSDPWVVSPCLQRPLRAVEIEMRAHAPDLVDESGIGQLFWKGPGDEDFDIARSVEFRVPNDGRVHVHRLELAGHPHLPDEVQWLRIDPVDGPCEVDLLSLRLFSDSL